MHILIIENEVTPFHHFIFFIWSKTTVANKPSEMLEMGATVML